MNILVATGIYPPEIGGPATYTVLLEKELPRFGHTVAVLPFAVSRHLPKVFRHLNYAWKLRTMAKGSDVIFAQDVASVGFPALVVAKLLGKKFFVRVPGDYAWEQAVQRFGVTETIDDFQGKRYGLSVGVLRFIQTCVTRYADVVITPSNYFKHLVSGWGVSKDRIYTIYNGVDLAVTAAAVEKRNSFTVVSAGRLVPWKGFEMLFNIIKEQPNWQLVILGNGPEMQRYQAFVSEHSLEERILLKGSVSRAEIFGWCAAADVFVLNTEFESFSYQLVEAMSVGAAVITTTVGSIPELITNGVEGVLLSPNDTEGFVAAIKSVATEPEVWAARKRAAQAKAQIFSITRTVEKLNTLLQRYA